MDRVFADRRHAGRELAAALAAKPDFKRLDAVVLALPRGGVPVAFEIAATLNAPLGVFVVRKLGAPGCRELAMGAIASGGIVRPIALVNGRAAATWTLRAGRIEIARLRRISRADADALEADGVDVLRFLGLNGG